MNVAALARHVPAPVKNIIAKVINAIGPLRRLVSKITINRYAYACPPRPRSLSMADDYTTWRGLVDKRFSGRHLPPASGDVAPAHPDIEAVLALFERREFRAAEDTSLLFPLFAQWFVDSFLRTKWEEGDSRSFRENESNHEIDLCQIYGMSEVQTTMLREGAGGRLASREINGESWPPALFEEQDGALDLAERYRAHPGIGDAPDLPGLYTRANFERVYRNWSPEQKQAAFAAGLEHGSSTLGNSAMNTLFLREHNRTAGLLAAAHPDWNDERLFQTARNVTMVVLLNIVIGDYIVHIAPVPIQLEAVPGMAEKEGWYRNNWMAVEFALLYRWHDLIPEQFTIGGRTRDGIALTRANALLVESGLGAVLRDASRQPAGRIGLGNTPDFLLDVKRLSIEMGRSCHLAPFNAYRVHYGLKPVKTFEALTGDPELAGRLRGLYGSIDRLEWFVGLFAEGYGESEMMGEMLTNMVANDAFTQALTNPLLAKSVYNSGTFGEEGMAIVRETRTLAQVIARNTDIDDPSLFGFEVQDGAGES